MIEKSTFDCRGPRKTLRPTLPMSVPGCTGGVEPATADPFELGIIHELVDWLENRESSIAAKLDWRSSRSRLGVF